MRALVMVPALTILLLAGCVPTAEVPTAAPTPTPTPTESAATPTPTPTAEGGTPVTAACDDLIPPQVMYDYNPNFVLIQNVDPAAGSLAAEAVADGGVFCQWINQSSAVTIDLSVASPAPDALTARANALVTSSNPVPTYGVEGYFQVAGSVGVAEAITPPYWVAMVSPTFVEPGDAAPLMTAVISALG